MNASLLENLSIIPKECTIIRQLDINTKQNDNEMWNKSKEMRNNSKKWESQQNIGIDQNIGAYKNIGVNNI
jgi:hypothetical protein